MEEAAIGRLVEKHRPGASWSYVAMPGGASTRRYYRVAIDPASSAVAMYVPEGDKPEEIDNGGRRVRWPFLEVRDLLEARGVRVPSVFVEETSAGWLLLEDLGDDTLANYLVKFPDEKASLYTQAVIGLARAQKALDALPEGSIVSTRAFDEELLRWEIDHFREWGAEARGFTFSEEDRTSFDAIADRIAKRVAALPRGFVHRDYQSRNLMVDGRGKDATLVWIDFQDALLGPRVYDLVALLNDSYQEFDRPFVEARLDEYAKEAGLDAAGRAALSFEFDLVTVQRKLKDAGRFVFIKEKKGNDGFLRFVVPTVHKVRAALARLVDREPDLAVLDQILRRTLRGEY